MVIKFDELDINLQWKWLFRPRQRDGMTVDDYYAQFCNWKDEMISVSFPAKEEDYIEGFIENLEWDIRWRSSKYESSRIGLTIAFYNAKFEESMMKLKASSHTPVVVNQSAEPDPIVVEEISICNHSDLVPETADELPSNVELVVKELPDSNEMMDSDDIKGNDFSNSAVVPDLEEKKLSKSGFKVLSIYCAHMATKWRHVLDSQPIQENGMSVEVYYDHFFNWKRKLEEVNYIGGEESYVYDFIYGLEIKLGLRVCGYKWKPHTLYGAFRRAVIEESLMKNDADMVLEEMPHPTSINDQGTEDVLDKYSNFVLDASLGSEFTIKASLLEKDNKPIQLLLQKPVGHNEGNVVDGDVVLSVFDLQAALGSLGDLTVNGSDNGSAEAWNDEATLAIKNVNVPRKYAIVDDAYKEFGEMKQAVRATLLEEEVINHYAKYVDFNKLILIDPGGSRKFVVSFGREVACLLFGMAQEMFIFCFKGITSSRKHANSFINTWEILGILVSSFVENEWGLAGLSSHSNNNLVYIIMSDSKLSSFYIVLLMLAGVVWDPSQDAISFYIIEDNDVLKRNGMGIQLALALKQEEKLNGASTHYYTHRKLLACSLVEWSFCTLLLITSSKFRVRKLYSLMELFVRKVGCDSINSSEIPGNSVVDLWLGKVMFCFDPGGKCFALGTWSLRNALSINWGHTTYKWIFSLGGPANYLSSYDTSAVKAFNGFPMKNTNTGRFDPFEVFQQSHVFLKMLVDYSNSTLLIPFYSTQNGRNLCNVVMLFSLFIDRIIWPAVSTKIHDTSQAMRKVMALYMLCFNVLPQQGNIYEVTCSTFSIVLKRIRGMEFSQITFISLKGFVWDPGRDFISCLVRQNLVLQLESILT